MLSKEGAEEDDLIWSAGVERVWQGLTGGAVLKKRLPLNIVVRVCSRSPGRHTVLALAF